VDLGLAHARLIKFLEEQEPCPIAGTSGINRRLLVCSGEKHLKKFWNFQVCYLSLETSDFQKRTNNDSESFRFYFHSIFWRCRFGDLKIPIQITATDMVREN
jgi:NTE family protein